MPVVSVIVPAYNAEATIKKTIDDILNQTYAEFELLIVDDGSTDATPGICDAYAFKDARVSVIHQENGGLSNARNRGTGAAKGSYITYIDSDDRVEPYYIEYLLRAVQETDADIACGGVDRVRELFELQTGHQIYNVEIFDRRDAIQEMLTGKKFGVGSWCRLVRRDWQLKNPFIEKAFYEDLSNTYKTYLMADRVAYVGAVLYHYVMRGGSITGRRVTSIKQCRDYAMAIRLCREGVLHIYPDLEQDADVCTARDFMSLYLSIHRCSEPGNLCTMETEILEWMSRKWRSAAANTKAPLGVRLRILLFGVSPQLYEKLYYIGIRFKGKAIV